MTLQDALEELTAARAAYDERQADVYAQAFSDTGAIRQRLMDAQDAMIRLLQARVGELETTVKWWNDWYDEGFSDFVAMADAAHEVALMAAQAGIIPQEPLVSFEAAIAEMPRQQTEGKGDAIE